jgi:acyl carrier protein
MEYQEVYEKTKQILMDYLRVEAEEITPDTHLVDDLAVDSIAMVELGFRLAETFSIPMPGSGEDLLVVKNMVEYVTRQSNGE